MRIGVLGCAGRMGRAVIAEVLASPRCELAGGCEAPGHAALGQDLGVLAGAEPIGPDGGDDAGVDRGGRRRDRVLERGGDRGHVGLTAARAPGT